MAIPTNQDLENFGNDLNSWGTYVTGDEDTDVHTRTGVSYPTLAKQSKVHIQKSLINSTPYANISLMNANTTATDGAFAFVYNDTNNNNGFYVRKSGNWVKSIYNPASFDYYLINILDTSNATPNAYVDFASGGIVALPSGTGFMASAFLSVKPNTTYRTSDYYNQQFAFYDATLSYISGLAHAGTGNLFTTPANAVYARFTFEEEWQDSLVIAEASNFPAEYVPYKQYKVITGLQIDASQIEGIEQRVMDVLDVEYVNIAYEDGSIGKYIDYSSGEELPVSGHIATRYAPVKPNTEYRVSDFYIQQFAFYDSDKKYISGLSDAGATHKFTTPPSAAFARFTIPTSQLGTVVIAEASKFPAGYVSPDKYMLPNLHMPSTKTVNNEIWVSADVNDADAKVSFRGNNAIQNALDSITDASADNRYTINVKRGLYKITKATEFLGYRGYPTMVLAKDHVDICGQGIDNTVVWAELPYDDDAIGASIDGKVYGRSSYQTLYDYSDDSHIRDMTFIAKNLRYAVHIDNPNGADSTRKYDNVAFVFKGNKGSLTAMGCGTSSGERTYIVGGRSSSDSNVAFASHNNVAFDKPSFWSFTNHEFITLSQPYAIYMQNDGSLLQDQLELIGNSFGGMGYALGYVDVWLSGKTAHNYDCFNHAEWDITGHGNEPFLFDNAVLGKSLLFKTVSKGLGNSVRFVVTSSAYPVLIKNNQSNSQSSIFVNCREYVDGYIVQDGTVDLHAMAWGCKDLTETPYLYDNNVVYTSLSKRLGDRSSSPLVLGVIVNGVRQQVDLNKDYTGMTNAQIVSDIQSQLSGVTVELVSYGRDYYPIINDVSERVYNNGSTYIPKGSVVTKAGGHVRLAQVTDKVYGVALDDIPVMRTTSEGVRIGEGRVMKRGYINTNQSAAHFVLNDNPNAPMGAKFRVVNGKLVTDSNGSVSVNVANGIVSINC